MKCIICQRYIEAQELLNEKVCSAICLGKKMERANIIKRIEGMYFPDEKQLECQKVIIQKLNLQKKD